MTPPVQDGITQSRGLTNDDYTSVQSLATLCNQHDGICLKLNDFMLRKRPQTEVNDFLFYKNGELVGYFGLYQFNQHEVEVSGMVHPAARRQGVFSSLMLAAMSEVARRGISKMIFINAQTSETGRSFLLHIGAKYSFSEYWMRLERDPAPQLCHTASLRRYEATDRHVVARSLSEGFEMPLEESLASLDEVADDDADRVRYVIECEGSAIGTLSVHYADATHAFIFGFAIVPEARGHGYGRQALTTAIAQARQDKRDVIELEVAAVNDGALSLYRSCGFNVLRANDYYVLYA